MARKFKVVAAALNDSEAALLTAIRTKRNCNQSDALKFALQCVPAEYYEEVEKHDGQA